MKHLLLAVAFFCCTVQAADRPGVTFKIFQFPADKIPRIDGNPDDWSIVPDDYAIGMDQLIDDTHPDRKPDPKDLDVKVKVGWVKGLNRLYFLYQAYDNYWDFAQPGLHNDIFELVVDGDMSGGPLIESLRNTKEMSERDAHFSMHGVQAQNYHIMTGCEGPQRAVESALTENQLIGLCWAILDYDDANNQSHAFWNLSRQHTMYGNTDQLVAFRLMPLEPQVRRFEANWSFSIVDMERRLVAFKDETTGKATSWKWTFGDGAQSTEQNPVHQYAKGGDYIVVLEAEGPEGKSRREKIWDVDLR